MESDHLKEALLRLETALKALRSKHQYGVEWAIEQAIGHIKLFIHDTQFNPILNGEQTGTNHEEIQR